MHRIVIMRIVEVRQIITVYRRVAHYDDNSEAMLHRLEAVSSDLDDVKLQLETNLVTAQEAVQDLEERERIVLALTSQVEEIELWVLEVNKSMQREIPTHNDTEFLSVMLEENQVLTAVIVTRVEELSYIYSTYQQVAPAQPADAVQVMNVRLDRIREKLKLVMAARQTQETRLLLAIQEADKRTEHLRLMRTVVTQLETLEIWAAKAQTFVGKPVCKDSNTDTLNAELAETEDMQAELNRHIEEAAYLASLYQTLSTDEPDADVEAMTSRMDTVLWLLHEIETHLQGRQVELQQAIEKTGEKAKEAEAKGGFTTWVSSKLFGTVEPATAMEAGDAKRTEEHPKITTSELQLSQEEPETSEVTRTVTTETVTTTITTKEVVSPFEEEVVVITEEEPETREDVVIDAGGDTLAAKKRRRRHKKKPVVTEVTEEERPTRQDIEITTEVKELQPTSSDGEEATATVTVTTTDVRVVEETTLVTPAEESEWLPASEASGIIGVTEEQVVDFGEDVLAKKKKRKPKKKKQRPALWPTEGETATEATVTPEAKPTDRTVEEAQADAAPAEVCEYVVEEPDDTGLTHYQLMIRSVADMALVPEEPLSSSEWTPELVDAEWNSLQWNVAQTSNILDTLDEETEEMSEEGRQLFRVLRVVTTRVVVIVVQRTLVTTTITELHHCWTAARERPSDEQAQLALMQRLRHTLSIVAQYISSLEVRFLETSELSVQEQLDEHKALLDEVRDTRAELVSLQEAAPELLSTAAPHTKVVIVQLITMLSVRLERLETRIVESEAGLQQKFTQSQELQVQVSEQERLIAEMHTEVNVILMDTSLSPEEQIQLLQGVQVKLTTCEENLHHLVITDIQLSGRTNGTVTTTTVAEFRQLRTLVRTSIVTLRRTVIVRSLYMKILREYQQLLLTATRRLQPGRVRATGLDDLTSQAADNRSLMHDMEVYEAVLDAVRDRADGATVAMFASEHEQATEQTHALQSQAAQLVILMQRAVKHWEELDTRYPKAQEAVTELARRHGLLSSIHGDQNRLTALKVIKQFVEGSEYLVLTTLRTGRLLTTEVSCASLDAQLNKMDTQWAAISDSITKELKKLSETLSQHALFLQDCSQLSWWMHHTHQDLNELAEVQLKKSPLQPQDVTDALTKVMEVRQAINKQEERKDKVIASGNQLIAAHPTTASDTRNKILAVNKQWEDLVTSLPLVEKPLVSYDIEYASPRGTMQQLADWLRQVESMLTDDKSSPLMSYDHVHQLLDKYQIVKVQITSKRTVIDQVNESIVEMSLDLHGPQRMDLAEQLGNVNQHWQVVSSEVAHMLKFLEQTYISWLEVNTSLADVQGWAQHSETQLAMYKTATDSTDIQVALSEIKVIRQQVALHTTTVVTLQTSAPALYKAVPTCADHIQRTLSTLDHSLTAVDCSCGETDNELQGRLDSLNNYGQVIEQLARTLARVHLELDQTETLAGNHASLQQHLTTLQTLQENLNSEQLKNELTTAETTVTARLPDGQAKNVYLKTTKDMSNRLRVASEDVGERLERLNDILQRWVWLQSETEQRQAWLDSKQPICLQLVHAPVSDTDVTLRECQSLVTEVRSQQEAVVLLSQETKDISTNLETASRGLVLARVDTLADEQSSMSSELEGRVAALESKLDRIRHVERMMGEINLLLDRAADTASRASDANTNDKEALQAAAVTLENVLREMSDSSVTCQYLATLPESAMVPNATCRGIRELATRWTMTHQQVREAHVKLVGRLTLYNSFSELCLLWQNYAGEVENELDSPISTTKEGLTEQQKVLKNLVALAPAQEEILKSIDATGQRMLSQAAIRSAPVFKEHLATIQVQGHELLLKLAQRHLEVSRNIFFWTRYRQQLKCMQRLLLEAEDRVPQSELPAVCIQKMHGRLALIQWLLEVQIPSLTSLLEAGGSVRVIGDDIGCALVTVELDDVDKRWNSLSALLIDKAKQLQCLLAQWDECNLNLEQVAAWLAEMRVPLDQDIPTTSSSLEMELRLCKDYEENLSQLSSQLAEVRIGVEVLAMSLRREDTIILQQRIALSATLLTERTSQVTDRRHGVERALSQWPMFDQRCSELMTWLDNMTRTVSNNGGLHIEDVVQKIEKDYKVAIRAKAQDCENLQQLGARLQHASTESVATDIQDKMQCVSANLHSLDTICEARLSKLRDTLQTVQELEDNMSRLRQWLAQTEHELMSPIIYQNFSQQEIRRLQIIVQEQQTDIDGHSSAIGSVLNLCEVLQKDQDACATSAEAAALQQAMKSLDKRWRNICAMSMDRRLRVEESSRGWQKIMEDHDMFNAWLTEMESKARSHETAYIEHTRVKDLLVEFEALQKNIQENYSQVEYINKQYRKLARDGATDSAGQLRALVDNVNRRYDTLLLRSVCVLRRLHRSQTVRDDEFEVRTDSLLAWLGDIDLQLTNIEHFSETEVTLKRKQIKKIQREVDERLSEVDQLDAAGLYLMQRCHGNDAVTVQGVLDELHRYLDDVLAKLASFQQTLHGQTTEQIREYEKHLQVTETETDHAITSETEPRDVRQEPQTEEEGWSILSTEKRRKEAEKEEEPEEKWDILPTIARLPDVSDNNEMRLRLAAQQDDLDGAEIYLKELQLALAQSGERISATEEQTRCKTPIGPEAERTLVGYGKLVASCRSSIDVVKHVRGKLEQEVGLSSLGESAEQAESVIERWELVRAQAADKERRLLENGKAYQRFLADLATLQVWLEEAENNQNETGERADSVHELQTLIMQHRDFLLQLDKHKQLLLSINLGSEKYADGVTPEAARLRRDLTALNQRWEAMCARARQRQRHLQRLLIHCAEFHETVHDQLVWLQSMEARVRSCEPLNLADDNGSLRRVFLEMRSVRRQLEERKPRVLSLRDTAEHLLADCDTADARDAREKLNILSNRLRFLLLVCSRYHAILKAAMDGTKSTVEDERLQRLLAAGIPLELTKQLSEAISLSDLDEILSAHERQAEEETPSPSFLSRVVRTALPLQALMLALVGLACLIPVCKEDYSCVLQNTFAQSLDPMLRYTDGAPPL
ncbi:PREDICTED: nesprin-1-like isoform X2 [Priapulus caudatus]|uniref:Nesprin-1-like isoform X2 n=1 Tax=Priapulus caudatus TaxID=37621 RepID=A0ABM1E7Z0_PRICU|nr:PREDICTED: nesprin-1-like isoform X2 [Priapulus caudatus]